MVVWSMGKKEERERERSKFQFFFSIVNSELTLMKNTLGNLDHITTFGNSLFDVWTASR